MFAAFPIPMETGECDLQHHSDAKDSFPPQRPREWAR